MPTRNTTGFVTLHCLCEILKKSVKTNIGFVFTLPFVPPRFHVTICPLRLHITICPPAPSRYHLSHRPLSLPFVPKRFHVTKFPENNTDTHMGCTTLNNFPICIAAVFQILKSCQTDNWGPSYKIFFRRSFLESPGLPRLF